jgi:arsenate reductase
MLIYGLKNCDKCRAARKVLQSAEFVDIREVPLTVTAIIKLIDTYDDDIVNKKSTTWRSLSEIDRQLPLIELLQVYPALIKRPIIKDQNGNYSVGWTTQIIERFKSV